LLENRSLIVVGLGAVVLAVVIGYFVRGYLGSRNQEMQTAFSDALLIYHATTDEDPEDPAAGEESPSIEKYHFATRTERYERALEAFQKISSDYAGAAIADFSSYYTSLCLIELDRKDKARSNLETLVQNSAHSTARSLARSTLAQLTAAAGEYEVAAELLAEILGETSTNVPKQIVLLRLAKAQESAGNLEEALNTFRRVNSEYPGTPSATEAQSQMRRLELQTGKAEEEPSSTEAESGTEEREE
jgi:TolA-binding protein